jgi:hypothetical protein
LQIIKKNNENGDGNSRVMKNCLSSIDMDDLLFLNNWIVGILPEIAN